MFVACVIQCLWDTKRLLWHQKLGWEKCISDRVHEQTLDPLELLTLDQVCLVWATGTAAFMGPFFHLKIGIHLS